MSVEGSQTVVLGTRGSDLALAQAHMAETALLDKCGVNVRTHVIRTSGDEPAGAAGRKGVFTAELERALLDRRIDVAVHSAKDLPSEMDRAVQIAAVLPRGAVEDLFVAKTPVQFAALGQGATIATGSVRRQRQARWLRPDLRLLDLRGNVLTRLRKFAGSDWDAIILARAGLERLGFSPPEFLFVDDRFFAEILPLETFVPSGGQGVIALQMRVEDAASISPIDHRETHCCLRAERELLRLLQGDCHLPVGVHARYAGGEIELRAQLFGDNEAPIVVSERAKDPCDVAGAVFQKIERGADWQA